MRLTILGATGGVGKHLVAHALRDGHEVTAAVRNPDRLPVRDDNLTVLRVDPLDAGSLEQAVAGADAVLSGIGAAGRRDPLKPASSSARAAVEAMSATGVRRILVVSAGPLNRSGTGQPAFARLLSPVLWAVLREVYTDLEAMERVLRESGLDWTSVRPPRLLDQPGRGTYRSAVDAGPVGGSIPRADVARAMLDLIGREDTVGHAVGVAS
ncbi:SDR family oxidoreductase [Saccharopolyspora taberi]|uniref:SDR family oxidoreductase n=1 Tax=Saccharopolyspora taberi TaxID=60895 RepID=A0ABN3VKD8_9PSEU